MFGLGMDTLNCVYFALFFVGVGYAIFVAITGGLSDVDVPDLGGADLAAGGLDAPDVAVSPISPITIATFVTVFGGVGVITLQFLQIDPRWSLLAATVGAFVASAVMFLFYSQVLIRSQASTDVRRSDLVGLEAVVTVPIGETAPGQVSYVTSAGRMSSMARSVDGRPIARGQFVTIVRASGPQLLVRPVASADQDES